MVSPNSFAGKRVLVTGGLGFIGSNLALALHRQGARVSVLDALIPEHGGDLHNVEECASELRIEVGDVADVSKLVPLIKDQEYVFHLAGQMSHGDSMRNPELQGVAGVFIHRALKGLPIQLFGGGDQLRDFNHVDDVVDAMLLAASTPECYGNTYNLGASKPCSLLQYTAFLSELCGVDSEAVVFPADRKLIDVGDYYGSYERFRAVTGWNPRIDLREGLAQSVEFFRTHRERYVK